MPKSRIYELITSHLLRQSTNESFWIRFTCCPNFNVSSFLMEGDIQIFKLVILLTLSSLVILLTWSSSQLIVIFLTLSKSQWHPSLLHWAGYWCFTSLGKTLGCKNNPKPLCLTTNWRTAHRSFTSYFQWFSQWN